MYIYIINGIYISRHCSAAHLCADVFVSVQVVQTRAVQLL